ncbi:BZIP transcription factor protein [Striga asiatica]|uniref:BZIP transcription factor protein n=1 Tax=Striga asiatica TaxID=4170 RepID=A0A5A7PVG1_STRAF|nr:BZIP transcription factor protein [Striga asiatica]
MVDGAFDVGDSEIDWDDLLKNFPDDLNFNLGDLPAADGLSASPNSGCSLSIGDIEQYLMDDSGSDHGETDQALLAEADGLFSDVVLDPSPGPDRSKEFSGSPESAVEGETDEEEKEKDEPGDIGAYALQTKQNIDGDDDNDPLAKKRKRQMRNRDAAVRSRERKKMYVKDLEAKNKYYEAECKRLGIMLQCCLAENQALRFSLHNNKAFESSTTKQESAVLLLESLLLGSLLGFLDIILCLLIMSTNLLPFLEKNAGSPKLESVVALRNRARKLVGGVFSLCMMGRTCKASRTRMKLKVLSAADIVG